MEKEVAAAGYIITFFNDVESLTNWFAYYANLLSNLKGKYPDEKFLSKIPDDERAAAINTIQSLRFWVNRSYIKFMALREKVPEFQSNTTIEGLYKEIATAPSPNFEIVQEYTTELNKLFVAGVVASLLVKARDIYSQYMGKQDEGVANA